MRKANSILNSILSAKEELRTALVALCRRLDATGAARVAEALAVAARDPKASMLARTLLPDAFAELAGRLPPERAAALEGTLVDSLLADLADTKLPHFKFYVAQALATAYRRPARDGRRPHRRSP